MEGAPSQPCIRGRGIRLPIRGLGNASRFGLLGFVDDYRGWDFFSRDNLPQDGNGHGTHVAGTIAAEGFNDGVIGVAPGAKVMPLRALGNNGSGFMSTLAAAFDYAGDLGVRVVNASLGGGYSRAVQDAIAGHPDTLFVVAAGNEGANADADVQRTNYSPR